MNLGHAGSKLGHILEKPCVCCRGLIFGQIVLKLGQNVVFDEILEEFKIYSLVWLQISCRINLFINVPAFEHLQPHAMIMSPFLTMFSGAFNLVADHV